MGESVTKEVEMYIVIAGSELEYHEVIKTAARDCDLNYIVTSVYNGTQLMSLLLRKGFYKTEYLRPPDLIIMDLKMPVMSGEKALKRIKSNDVLRNIPIYITGESGDQQKIVSLLHEGADGYIVKPVSRESIRTLIGHICGNINLRHQQEKPGY
jgi:CheY-like chemotaxis protein